MTAKLSQELAQETIDAIATYGTMDGAARQLGLARSTLQSRAKAAQLYGLKPTLTTPVAPPTAGYHVKGTSTLVNMKSGEAIIQWVKTSQSQIEQEAAMAAALKAFVEQIKPAPKVSAPKHNMKDLLTLYTITDAHIGALAWDKESGEDWDLAIAERVIVDTLSQMIAAAPASATGVLNQLGDYLHFDSLTPMTPTNQHILDADSRYQKVVQVAVRVLIRVIDAMLEKHANIYVNMKEGNHDPTGSVWLRVMLAKYYEKNKRVIVDQSPNPYTVIQWGSTLLGFYHGHLAKKVKLPEIFAAQFRKLWGECEHVYIHVGHLHNQEEIEYSGAKVIQHPTLAAKDAYAARFGWLSKRQASSMTYHKTKGEVGRGTFLPVD